MEHETLTQKLLKKINGTNNFERQPVSIDSRHQRNDEGDSFNKRS